MKELYKLLYLYFHIYQLSSGDRIDIKIKNNRMETMIFETIRFIFQGFECDISEQI